VCDDDDVFEFESDKNDYVPLDDDCVSFASFSDVADDNDSYFDDDFDDDEYFDDFVYECTNENDVESTQRNDVNKRNNVICSIEINKAQQPNPNIYTFSGKKNENIEDWLRQFNCFTKLYEGFNEENVQILASSYLRDDAG
jgi:hypothetical protein